MELLAEVRIWILIGLVLKVKNLDKYERKDLIAWLITQTERGYLKALESNQLSAAIGSLNLMHRITIEAAEKKANKPYHGNCKF